MVPIDISAKSKAPLVKHCLACSEMGSIKAETFTAKQDIFQNIFHYNTTNAFIRIENKVYIQFQEESL